METLSATGHLEMAPPTLNFFVATLSMMNFSNYVILIKEIKDFYRIYK